MKKVYNHVNIYDGTEEMVLQKDKMVIVEDGIITEIKDAEEVSGSYDAKGAYLIPGLINMHVHTPGNGFPKKKATDQRKLAKLVMSNALTRKIAEKICYSAVKTELLSGTTTIRCVGGLGHIDSLLRDKIASGKLAGPRIFACDQALTVPHGHMEGSVAYGARSKEDFLRFIEENKKAGVDTLKIMITGGVLDAKKRGEPGEMKMTPEQVKLCCDKAHELGLRVAAHVESPEGVKVALENGVDFIEHGSYMDEETADLFLKKDAALIVTLSPAIPIARISTDLTHMNDDAVYNSEVLLEGIIDAAKKCLRKGVKVGLGTDTVCPFITHYDMWRELEYFHRLTGASRKDALYRATLGNASLLGISDKTGSIEEGKVAEFILVKENPMEGFSAVRNPLLVVKGREEYDHPSVKKSELAERELDAVMETLK